MPSKPYHVTLADTKTKRNRSDATALLMNRNFVQFVWADDPVHYRATYKQAPHRHDYEQLHIQTAGIPESTLEALSPASTIAMRSEGRLITVVSTKSAWPKRGSGAAHSFFA